MNLEKFRKRPIIGILRGIREEELPPLVEVMVASGLETVEITMNTAGAALLIRQLVDLAAGRLNVGAGTVLDMESLHGALDAGATFVVTPTLIPDVTTHCAEHGVPVFPGALTPTEIHRAFEAGATMVKVFPANMFGPAYFKDIRGPFADLELLACGGVNASNAVAYFAAGASAVAFGGSIFRSDWLRTGSFQKIGNAIRELVHAVP